MCQVIAVSRRGFKIDICFSWFLFVLIGPFLIVRSYQLILHCFWIGKYGIIAADARGFWHYTMMDRKSTAFHFDHTFFSYQFYAFLATRSTYKIYLQCKLE